MHKQINACHGIPNEGQTSNSDNYCSHHYWRATIPGLALCASLRVIKFLNGAKTDMGLADSKLVQQRCGRPTGPA